MIVLHIRKDEMREYKYHSLMKKLSIEMHFISSFKDPSTYVGVCYSRPGDDNGKIDISKKATGIFRKLFKLIGNFSFVDVI